MKLGAFPKNFKKKRSARKRRVEFCSQESLFPGAGENSKGFAFAATRSRDQSNGGYNNIMKYYVRVMSSQCVSEELESLPGPEERKLLSRRLPNLLSPRGPRSKGKVARKGGVPFSHNTGGYNNIMKYYVRVMSSQCVSEELESLPGPEERKLLSRRLPNLLSPRGPRSKRKVARKGGVPFSRNTGGYNNIMKYYVRVMSSQCVSEEQESLPGPEERKLLGRRLPNLLFPRGPRSKGKVARKGGVPFNHNTGEVSAGRISNELKRTRASLKSRKRKNKQKDESGDSEEIIPSRIRFRGQARRARDSSNTGSTERTKLDSATFLHYFMHIWNDFSEEKLKSVAFFDPLWFTLYADERNRSMVLDWIKGMGIFLKKYVLVPIVLWSHWSLLIFCNLGEGLDSENGTPCLLLLDSLHAIGPKRLEPLIRSGKHLVQQTYWRTEGAIVALQLVSCFRLLSDIYKTEGRTETREQLKKMPLLIPKVPQQKKGDECGYVVLCYVSLFVECAPENFSTSNGYPYFMNKDWFTVEGLESFYKRLDSFPPLSNDHDDSASMDSGACVETISADKSRSNMVICLD